MIGEADAVRPVVGGRCGYEAGSFGAIEYPDDEQVREPFDVRQPGFELWQYVEKSFGFEVRGHLARNATG